jgi:hypothetical protein
MTCPFCEAPLSEPDNLEDHEDWCRDNQTIKPVLDIQQWVKPIQRPCWLCGGRSVARICSAH